MKLTKRQELLYQFLQERGEVTPAAARDFLMERFGLMSRMSLVRDFNALKRQGLISRVGKGRGTGYAIKKTNIFLRFVDPKSFFGISPDQRMVKGRALDLSARKSSIKIFTESELIRMHKLNDRYKKRIQKYSFAALKKEYERITIELSWKSSRMEGNTYSLIDTEILLKEGLRAKGKTEEETRMILNHKNAIEYLFNAQKIFKKITLHQIENIHQLLTAGLGVKKGLRSRPVGIIGTAYKPPDNQHKIRDKMEEFLNIVNLQKDAFSKALLAVLLVSYIQPFEDGNKRTARLLGNGIMLAHELCPLSYRSADEAEYKKALIIFYEQNSALMFKELFMEQFVFAVEHYFL